MVINKFIQMKYNFIKHNLFKDDPLTTKYLEYIDAAKGI